MERKVVPEHMMEGKATTQMWPSANVTSCTLGCITEMSVQSKGNGCCTPLHTHEVPPGVLCPVLGSLVTRDFWRNWRGSGGEPRDRQRVEACGGRRH